MLAGAFTQGFDISQKWFVGHGLCSCLISHGFYSSDRIKGEV
jgi:hypothetical protein